MAFIVNLAVDTIVLEQRNGRFKTAPGERDVLRKILRTADDAGLVPYRKAHRLCLVELRVLECREPDQAVGKRLR